MTLTGQGLPKRWHPVFFSKRFERTRGSAPPRTSLHEADGPAGEQPNGSSCSPIGSGSDTSAGGLRQ
jgi:hypothetical protein